MTTRETIEQLLRTSTEDHVKLCNELSGDYQVSVEWALIRAREVGMSDTEIVTAMLGVQSSSADVLEPRSTMYFDGV